MLFRSAILGVMAQAADHPVGLAFPEGAYLKGLLCRVAGAPEVTA